MALCCSDKRWRSSDESGSELTSGGQIRPSGGTAPAWQQPKPLTAAAYLGFGLIHVVVNAASLIDERRALGQTVIVWQPWVWEATSFLAWLLLLPAILWIADHASSIVRPASALAVHLLAVIPISLGHSAATILLRKLAYWGAGTSYERAGNVFAILFYEFRKDAITYALVVLAFLLIKRLFFRPAAPTAAPPTQNLIEVRDGNRSVWLKPEEVEWVGAAGNYVELHCAFGVKLVRRTLAELESDLTPLGFARIHRSRLVRKAAIASVETRQSGDFDVVLRSGQTISGSRRYRDNIKPKNAAPTAVPTTT